ncbi:MAG: hypothetical protein GX640_19065, partial [Fibrobacter sp.]|nr:hypothetical protein [Fibrobacter sp.]
MFKYSDRILLFAVALVTGVQICYGDFSFPLKDSLWSTFNDSIASGTSRTIELNFLSDHVEWVFKIDNGAPWPYAGISASLQFPDSTLKNWQRFSENDTLILELSSNREGPLVIQVSTIDPVKTKIDDPVSFRVLQTKITISTEKRLVKIPLRILRVADWWKTQYKVPPEDNNLYLDSIISVDFVITDIDRIGKQDTLKIHYLQLKHHEETTLKKIFIVFCVVSAIFITFLIIKNQLFRIKPVFKQQVYKPVPVESDPPEWQRVRMFLESNYQDPELNLEKCASLLCISES